MTNRDWKLVQVVVYPPGSAEETRMQQTVRLPHDAGIIELLAELANSSPDVFAEVCGCVARASGHSLSCAGDDPPLLTLDHYFALGGPVVCPDLAEGIS